MTDHDEVDLDAEASECEDDESDHCSLASDEHVIPPHSTVEDDVFGRHFNHLVDLIKDWLKSLPSPTTYTPNLHIDVRSIHPPARDAFLTHLHRAGYPHTFNVVEKWIDVRIV